MRQGPSSARVRRNSRMRAVIGALPTAQGAANRPMMRVVSSSPARDGDALANGGLSTRCAALDWNGETPFRTAGNDEQAFSVATPAVEGRQRPKKPGPSLL